jgi:hypothetical protein
MEKQSSDNHGEGNPEAAERFNSAETGFVNSPQGQKKIQEGAQVRADEEADLTKAEQLGRARSKGDDSTCLDGL